MSISMSKLAVMFPLSGAVVLAVDDIPENVRHLRMLLTAVGASVLTAESVEEARHLLATARPHLILLDIDMPDTDGITFCTELKADPQWADIPVIFLSGLTDSQDKLSAFVAGGADYVAKPFLPAEVLARASHHYKMVCANQALRNEKEELQKRNSELLQARQETLNVFNVLAEQLCGKQLDGKYLLEERIGVGSFGVVYRARQLALSRAVAVKVLRPTHPVRRAQQLHRFQQEITLAARVFHPNVVGIIDGQISTEGIPYLVMELLTGHSLNEELGPERQLPLLRCFQICTPVCAALVEAHRVGVLHRDIKPANLFLHQQPDGEVVKILDFGIAKLLDTSQTMDQYATQQGDFLGTLCYMSPEQMDGAPCDGRTDVYSVGVTLFEMLTGRVPFPGRNNVPLSVMQKQRRDKPPCPSTLNPGLPAAFDELILRALSYNAQERPTADAFLRELMQLARSLLDSEQFELLLSGLPNI